MGQALYRKYRSASFDEVIGQDHIVQTLKSSLKSGHLNHAYLLTGPRGVGKTSVARLLAYGANGLAYDEGGIHLDIIEIDAASNRRIDEVRDLREKVHIAPTSGKYKVYIIDEVHMLTREAFNALLKTLEEPPEHVIFILATTEAHKLPDTIISRCLRFTFHPIASSQLEAHLAAIASKESFDIDNEAIALIARHGDGSFRDSISLLDQIKSIGKSIRREDVEQALGLASEDLINDLLEAVKSGDPKLFDSKLQSAYNHGANETNLAKQIGERVRSDMMGPRELFDSRQSLELLGNLLDVPSSRSSRAKLELVLLDLLFEYCTDTTKAKSTKEASEEPMQDSLPEQPPPEPMFAVETAEPTIQVVDSEPSELWQETLAQLKKQNNTLYSIARVARVEVSGNTLSVMFKFPFHFKRMNDEKNKRVLSQVIKDLGHDNMLIQISLASDEPYADLPAPAANQSAKSQDLSTINNIFGDSEVLES